MIIGFDINEANITQRVGVNQVAFELFRHLVKINRKHQIIAFSKDRPLPDFPLSSKHLKYETFGPSKAWVLTGLTKRLIFCKPKIDILFSPSHYTPLFSFTPSVIDIMDLSYEHFGSEYFTNYDLNQLKRWTPLSVKKAKTIVTISEFSKQEIIRLYKVNENKIKVIYPGLNNEIYHAKIPNTKVFQVKNKFNITGKYFLYVGTLQPRKNLTKLIDGFKLLIDENHPNNKYLKLVICGKKGWLYDQIFTQVKDLGLGSRVIFTGFVQNEDIPGLIKGCLAYVLPSLYEGFGMPVVEAQSVGSPVIVSKTSSLPEVAGDSAIFIEDPQSAQSIKNALFKVLNFRKKIRLETIAFGKENAKRFDWDKSAKNLLQLLESLAV